MLYFYDISFFLKTKKKKKTKFPKLDYPTHTVQAQFQYLKNSSILNYLNSLDPYPSIQP